jgi:hypothetical protein
MFMSVDRRLALPVEVVLVTWECTLARVGWAASAAADVLAAARVRLLRTSSSPRQQSTRTNGVADVIVLADERKRER